MKGTKLWSYAPYSPPLRDTGGIYICRIVPGETSIHFEWIPGAENYAVYYKKREDESFTLAGMTAESSFTIENLSPDTDYAFYVESGDKKSLVRLARCGKAVGTPINYLHPDDEAYSFSGRYLCSPSIVMHPDGYMLASMDVFAPSAPQNLTLIFRSDDKGESWHYVSELMPCFWGKLFCHKGDIYMLGVSTEYGDLLIGRSTDGGKTFSAPVAIFRGANGKSGSSGIHKAPQNVLFHNGRIYTAVEWGAWANREFGHAAMILSCGANDDLLDPESWSLTYPKAFDPSFTKETERLDKLTATIEGTVTISPEGELLDILRFHDPEGRIIAYRADKSDPEKELEFYRLIDFPANYSKFSILYDDVSKRYYSVATRIFDKSNLWARNLLSLMVSDDLYNWRVAEDLLDYSAEDSKRIGFQYVDFLFDGDDLVYLCRTAINGANDFHNSNYITFHRIKNFRKK